MKRTLLTLMAATSMAAAIPAIASAQPWQNINQRQANLDQRIDVGVRNGQLTRAEADRLRVEFNGIARLEATYRASRPGLTVAEMADLDRRFDALSARIRFERSDRDDRQWQNINQRQAALERRIERAMRDRRLSQREARSIRAEFQAIARLEANYRASRPGLTAAERADLDRRFDRLSARIRMDANDRDYGYGYGYYNR